MTGTGSALGDTASGVPEPPVERPSAVTTARPGDLTTPWRIVLGSSWAFAFFAYAAVWQASVQIGTGTWWIGPRAVPAPAFFRLLPFVLTLTLAMLVVYNSPRIVRVSFVGTALAAAIAIPDFSRSTGLAVAELVIAGLLFLVTLSAVTGQYRVRPASSPGWAPPTTNDGSTGTA